MITSEVVGQASVIAAAIAVAAALIDIVNEYVGHRGVLFLANFLVVVGFEFGLMYLLGGSAAVIDALTH